MNLPELQGTLASLESYAPWREARQEQQIAYNATPQQLNPAKESDLRIQLDYMDAKWAEHDARAQLMFEVADLSDRVMPALSRLGTVAAFEATKGDPAIKMRESGLGGLLSLTGAFLAASRTEQHILPLPHPLERAVQVTTELERLTRLFNTRRSLPVLMVWNHNLIPDSRSYDEIVLGEVPHPQDAFHPDLPRTVEVGGVKRLEFTVPTQLHGINKKKVIVPNAYVQAQDRYENPTITTLSPLVAGLSGWHGPNALYIGRSDVRARASRAKPLLSFAIR